MHRLKTHRYNNRNCVSCHEFYRRPFGSHHPSKHGYRGDKQWPSTWSFYGGPVISASQS
jgi:hypothetical protein